MKTCEMRRAVRSPVSRCHGGLQQVVGVQAAFHDGLGIAGTADDNGFRSGLRLVLGLNDREKS